MEYRLLGSTDLRVSALGFGCSHLGRSVFNDNRRQSRSLLETAFEGGINFFDTAPTYSYGDSERLLGSVFANRRDQVIFATKGGYRYSSYASYARCLLPFIGPFRGLLAQKRERLKSETKKRQNFSAQFLRRTLENSLRRLRTDYVDLYQLHSPSVTAIEADEVLRFLEDSVREGKVRHCGASVGTIMEARRCLKFPVFATLQITFNLVEQAAAETLFPYAESKRLGLIGRTPLSRGVLTDKYRVVVGPAPETLDPEVQSRRRLALDFLVSEQHPTIEIAALRFILDHPEIATVLTGTSDPKNLRTNMTAVSACPLSVDVMAKARRLQNIDGRSVNG